MTDKPTPEQIQQEVGMTRDEAMMVWRDANAASQKIDRKDGPRITFAERDEAAATVIQQAFAERDGKIERLRDGLEQSLQGWENVAELNLIPGRYMDGAVKLAKVCRQALAAKGDSRG